MERQLKYFFDFLENDKKLSDNTLQSYKRDLKQFKRYIEECEINYNHVKEEDIKDYIKELQEELDKEIENKENIVNKNINTYEQEDGVDIYVTYEVLENIGTNEKIVF